MVINREKGEDGNEARQVRTMKMVVMNILKTLARTL